MATYTAETGTIFRISDDIEEMTPEILQEYLTLQEAETPRYKSLRDYYEGRHDIFYQEAKAQWKPDNRLAVNFPAYITDTFSGFFWGEPVGITTPDESVSEAVDFIDKYNTTDDLNIEIFTRTSICGRAYEIYYTDEDGEQRIAPLWADEGFMIYSESIQPRPRFFVRGPYTDTEGTVRGSIADDKTVQYWFIDNSGNLVWDGEATYHGFDYVPATEYITSDSRQGIFEGVLSLIDGYDRVLSDKANDIAYFADAYLKILGGEIDDATLQYIRDNRVISYSEPGVMVDFLSKPDADTSIEHFLDRTRRDIFTTAMVADPSSDDFSTPSGIALRYKLIPMMDHVARRQHKFTAGLVRRYMVLFSSVSSGVAEDAWSDLSFRYTDGIPVDIQDAATAAQGFSGILSHRTILEQIPTVTDPDAEMQRIEEEIQGMSELYQGTRETEG